MSESALARGRKLARACIVTEREPPEVPTELYRRCVKATRGLAIAEALLLLVGGFTLDDLGLLAFPGYAAGALGAVLVLAFGRLVHGRSLANRIVAHKPDEVDLVLDAARLRNTLAAIGALLVFVAWLVFFTAGVPPWAL